jgi:outer membrane protein insertion porin family
MKKTFLFLVALALVLPAVLAAQEIVERIDVVGNDRVTKETILYYLSTREGEYYNEDILRRDFTVLWTTGFFANVRIEEEAGTRGKIIKIIVEENPVVKAVTFKTGKKVKEDDIVNKLKEKDEYILAYSYYNPAKLQKVKKTINDLLAEKGLQAAKIDTEVAKRGKNEVEVLIRVDEGPKIRVGEVVFEGRAKLPEGFLREAMKDNQKHNLYSWIAGKDAFKQNKLPDDVDKLKQKFQEFGYMEATVGEPRVEEVTKRNVLFRRQKMMRIIIPVSAGYLYRVGEIKIDGNKILRSEFLRSLVKLEAGDIYNTKVREKAMEKMQEFYRNFGYLFCQIAPVENLDPKRKLVNLTFNIYEGEIAFLHRLEFRGNIYTKDKVIRREMLIAEGDPFRFEIFKNSILRIKQLGLVDLEKDPEIKQNNDNPAQMDVTVNVKEMQRNNIQFTAGYSGYEGPFVAFSYSTVNFLGAGENLELVLQHGKRIKNYSFGFTEPYVFDQPITVGANIFHREYIYPYLYNRRGTGADLTLGARLIGYTRGNLTYSYEKVHIWQPETTTTDEAAALYTSPYYDPVYLNMYGYGNYNMSSLMPMIYYSTVDSPLTPSSGTLYSASVKYSGSFLGGEINLWKPRLEFTHYQPLIRGKHTLGFHVEYQFIKAFGNSEIPFWEKFYLGGERSIRGYEIYTIGPRNENGTILGADKSLVINAEYILHAGGPLYLIGFYDIGNGLLASQRFSLRNMYTSAGLEARIFVPALRVPFRLIFAYNNRKIYRDDTSFAFRFAIGTTF